MSHTITGTLSRCATPLTTSTGQWLVRLEMRQPGDASRTRIVALRNYGQGDAAAIAAHSAARRLPAGSAVRVYGRTLRAQPCEVILLEGVDVIEPAAALENAA